MIMATLGKRAYAEMFGPTVGDRVRLADTDLLVAVTGKKPNLAAAKPFATACRNPSALAMAWGQAHKQAALSTRS
jgi:hypothetical protein